MYKIYIKINAEEMLAAVVDEEGRSLEETYAPRPAEKTDPAGIAGDLKILADSALCLCGVGKAETREVILKAEAFNKDEKKALKEELEKAFCLPVEFGEENTEKYR